MNEATAPSIANVESTSPNKDSETEPSLAYAGSTSPNGESESAPSISNAGSTSPNKDSESVPKKAPSPDRLKHYLLRKPKLLGLGWIIVAVLFFSVPPVAYFSWWHGIPSLSSWPNGRFLPWIPAAFGIFFLAFAPTWVLMGAVWLLGYVADVSLSVEDEGIRDAQNRVKETEAEAIRRFENTDAAGLLPLLTYSREQLNAYYKIGLNQTRRSFFHGIVAMWLGFGLLLTGLALYIVPLEKYGLNKPTQDFKIVILSGAAIIEFISALFLWMYRSTTAQLTYLYDRQMYSHTAILCFRMASTIEKVKSDETKASIVTKLLDWTAKPERPALPGGSGLAGLLGQKQLGKQGE